VFLGYSFGAHIYRPTGRRYLGASPSKKSLQRLKDKVSEMLTRSHVGKWKDVGAKLNSRLAGWAAYFSPGTHSVTDKAIEAHVYDRVRHFLARRHKMPPQRVGPFTVAAVFGELGVVRLRPCRRGGVLS